MLLLAMNIVAQAVPSESDSVYWTVLRRLLPHGLHVYGKMSISQRRQDCTLFDEVDVPAWTTYELKRLFAAQVKSREGEAMYKRALAGYEKALGPGHTSTLRTINNLGNLYRDQDRLAEAEAMYERALAGFEKALRPEHTSTLHTINNLGNLYRDQDRLTEAEAMYERALAGYENALGLDHTSTLNTVHNLGCLYADQGRLAKAEAMYERALAGKEKALGPEHTSTLDTVNNLGNLYADQGRLVEAEAMYKRALAGYEKALGPGHTSTLDTVNNLGSLYRKRHYLHISSINKSRVRNFVFASKQDMSSRFIVPVSRLWATWGLSRTKLMEDLGHMLLLEGSLHDAVVAFEQQISSNQDGILHSNVVCDGCGNPIRLPNIRFVCPSCDDVDLWPTCHLRYEREGHLDIELPTCQNHAFLAVPRHEWSTLPPGVVSTDGTTVKEWMNNLLVSLTEINVET
jgi:tetratricopeptide (TPR) repeat protein